MNVTLASLGAQAASLVPLAPTVRAEAACSPCCEWVQHTYSECYRCCTYSRCWSSCYA